MDPTPPSPPTRTNHPSGKGWPKGKTAEGKAKSGKNALKTGAYSEEMRAIRRYFAQCRGLLKEAQEACRALERKKRIARMTKRR